jgi:ribonuclease PH
MTGSDKFVEMQATAEHTAFADEQLAAMIALARTGMAELRAVQQQALAGRPA